MRDNNDEEYQEKYQEVEEKKKREYLFKPDETIAYLDVQVYPLPASGT